MTVRRWADRSQLQVPPPDGAPLASIERVEEGHVLLPAKGVGQCLIEEAKGANLMANARAEGGVGGGTPMTGGGGARGAAGRGRKVPTKFLRMLCGRNNEGDLIGGGPNSGCMLKIMDMRPKSAAMGNRTQGESLGGAKCVPKCVPKCHSEPFYGPESTALTSNSQSF